MGRPPRPTEQKAREGKLRSRDKPPTLVGGRGVVKPPAYARKLRGFMAVWNEVTGLLESVLDTADAILVEALVMRLMEARAADQMVWKFGVVVSVERVGRDGSSWDQLQENPAAAVSRKAWTEVRQLADRLGIGPSARARLGNAGVEGRGLDLPGLGELVELRAV